MSSNNRNRIITPGGSEIVTPNGRPRRGRPIRVFYSTLSGEFLASREYTETTPGSFNVWGQKFDVTQDIALAINAHDVQFQKRTAEGGMVHFAGKFPCPEAVKHAKRLAWLRGKLQQADVSVSEAIGLPPGWLYLDAAIDIAMAAEREGGK